jgi:hypothetical protein
MAATAAHIEVQNLLRFLTKDAKLPLSQAMSSITSLRKLRLGDAETIAHASNADLKVVFPDEKVLKQVLSAAKRASNPNKRGSAKSRAVSKMIESSTPGQDEAALTLPSTDASEEQLANARIETNRAPLFLAFALVVLSYTQAEQPLSSRLSLAQAVVSAGAASKAKYVGITTDPTPEEDGWAQGQPKIRIMGRDVAVMRRHTLNTALQSDQGSESVPETAANSHDAFWGIDLEALRRSNGPLIAGKSSKGNTGPPIHTPQAARNYLLKSMVVVEDIKIKAEQSPPPKKTTKVSAAGLLAEKEEAAARVLKAIDIVCQSWKDVLTPDELDRRAQQWYALVRPEVAQGRGGWGQRGPVGLSDILKLKRIP